MTDIETPIAKAPAGWYPSTTRPATQQYWDGAAWTENFAPLNPVAPSIVINQRAQYRATNHVAHVILSLLTGGLWLFVYIPLVITRSVANSHR